MTSITESFAAAEAARKQRPRSEKLGHITGIVLVALTEIIQCYSAHFKVWPILVYFAIWFGVLLLKGFSLLRINATFLWLLALPLLSDLSTLWSDYPNTSIYLGTALIVTFFCITIINRAVTFASLLLGLIIGTDLALLISVASGIYSFDVMSGSYSLTGYFGSKNEIGFVAELGLILCLTLLTRRASSISSRVLSFFSFIFCLYCMYVSHSGTSLLSFIASVAAMLFVLAVAHTPAAIRAAFLGLSLLMIVALTSAVIAFGGQDLVLKSLGKDTTLTGRTYLWHEGIKIGMEHPLLGHGYNAFWVQGNPRAERYWHEFFIDDRSGFHFHSSFVQSFVDLGLVGMLLVVGYLLANIIVSLRAMIRRGVNSERVMLFGLSIMFLIRAWPEVDFFSIPFGIGTLYFYSVLLRLSEDKRTYEKAAAQAA